MACDVRPGPPGVKSTWAFASGAPSSDTVPLTLPSAGEVVEAVSEAARTVRFVPWASSDDPLRWKETTPQI